VRLGSRFGGNGLKRLLLYLAVAWTVLFLTIVWYVDFDPQMQPLNQISDYLMTFHAAGWIVQHGELDKLYPPHTATGFAGMPFDVIAHQLLPKMPAPSVAEFMYMPLAGAIFVPFSFLPLSFSLFAWQMLSLAAVFLSAQLMWLGLSRKGAGASKVQSGVNSINPTVEPPVEPFADQSIVQSTGQTRGTITDWSGIFLRATASLFVIPVCLTIWIGQVGAVFGMLPLALGFYLLHRNRTFAAGLIWSLALLKPQFLVPVAVISFALLLQKKYQAALGIVVGLVLIGIVNVVAFGPSLNLEWLNCLRISDMVYSDPRSGISTQIATSLPRSLILLLPIAAHPELKLAVYGLAGAVLLSAIGTIWMVQKRVERVVGSGDIDVVSIACLVGIFVTPLVMPHFFLYDYCLFALALPFAFSSALPTSISMRFKQLMFGTILLVNLYSIIVMAAHEFAFPLAFMMILFLLYCVLIRLALDSSKQGSK
jgi:Glycosyltransferase family 87